MNKAKVTKESGKQEVFISKEFDAPRELVFKAHTDPDLYVQWIGPRRYTTTLLKFEPRSGGMWQYISKDKEGNEFRFHGVYHEVLAPERLLTPLNSKGYRKMNMSAWKL